jgi:arginyl-tRNA synthetase
MLIFPISTEQILDIIFQEQSRQEVVRLQSGNAFNVLLWKIICEKSRIDFQQIYDLLKVKINERGESFYNSMLSNIITLLEQKELLVVSEGAKCVFLPSAAASNAERNASSTKEAPPLIVQKSDGGYLYATTDLAALTHRIQVEGADQIIYVTGVCFTLSNID